MGLRNFLSQSSNKTYSRNREFLEEHDLVNILGSPDKLFLKFLDSKNLNIREDEITQDIIDEFRQSGDFAEIELEKIQRTKEILFTQRKVWINLKSGDEFTGTDLILDHVGILIERTNQKIPYSQIIDIEISEGGWSKKQFSLVTSDDEIVFTVNEDFAVPLKEILEDNIEDKSRDEIDDLLELYELFNKGEISEEEYELRKALIYSDEVYCTECGARLDFDSKFCSECGSQIK